MIALIIIAGVVLYIFGGLVIFRVCDNHWGTGCRWSGHADCGHTFAAGVMGILWPVAPPAYLLSLALWHGAVIVSDMFKPKEDR